MRSAAIHLFAALVLIGAAGVGPASATRPEAATPAASTLESQPIRRTDVAKAPTTGATQSESSTRSRPTTPSSATSVDIGRVAKSLGIVIALILVARWAMKRLFPAVTVGRNSQVIRVVSRSVIGPKQQFLLVQLGKRLVLVGDSGANMSALVEVTDPDEVAELVGKLQSESSASSVTAFSSLFRKADSEFRKTDDAALRDSEAMSLALSGRADEDEGQPEDQRLAEASGEIAGLMDRVRGIAKRMKS